MGWECWSIEVGPGRYETCTKGYPELPCTRRDEPRREPVCVGGEGFANCYEEGAVAFGANGPVEEGDFGRIDELCRVAADGTPDTCWPVAVPRGTYPTCQGNFDQLPCEQAWRDQ